MSDFLTMWKSCGLALAIGAGCLFSAGCGGDGTSRAPVSGSVTYNSQPVGGGSITFTPILTGAAGEAPARPASAKVQSNGTFIAGTDKAGDGVSIGRHRISYSAPVIPWEAPEWDGQGEPPAAPKSEFDGLVPSTTEVEVKAGGNDLKIELVQPMAAPQ